MKEIKKIIKYYICDKDEIITIDHISFIISKDKKIIKTYQQTGFQEKTKEDILNLVKDDNLIKTIFMSYIIDTSKSKNNTNFRKIVLLIRNKLKKKINDIEENNNYFILQSASNIINKIRSKEIEFEKIKILDNINTCDEYDYYDTNKHIDIYKENDNFIYVDEQVYKIIEEKIKLENDLNVLEVFLYEDIK